MLSKRLLASACARSIIGSRSAHVTTLSKSWRATYSHIQRSHFHSTHLLQDEVVKVPQMAESITEGTLKQWQKKVGDIVQEGEEIATIETDKIDVTVNAPKSGKITSLLVSEEDTVAVGQDLFKLELGGIEEAPKPETENSAEESKAPSPTEKPMEKPPAQKPEPTVAAPPPQQPASAAAKLEKKPAPPSPSKKEDDKKQAQAPQALLYGTRNETRVKMSRMRLRISERLKEAQNTAASLTTFNEIDMSAIMNLRSKYKDEILKTHDVKLGFMSAFARASCLALREIPAANAIIEGDEIIYRDYIDLSVAVATPKGLVTPVVRNAEAMGFVEFEKQLLELSKKARDNKLTLEDMSGGTFTISNGGVFGSLYGTPILNYPQSAILGMHAIKERPVVVDGQIVVRPIMVVALTYDHRMLDGREAVTFLVKLRDYIQDPIKMLF